MRKFWENLGILVPFRVTFFAKNESHVGSIFRTSAEHPRRSVRVVPPPPGFPVILYPKLELDNFFSAFLRKKWPWMGLKFQNLLKIFWFCPRKVPYEGLIFLYFGVFATLRGTGGGEKRYPDQSHIPVPLSAQYVPNVTDLSHTVFAIEKSWK